MPFLLAPRTRRCATRRHVLLPCHVVRERGFRLVSNLACDVSTDGMLVFTGERILTGEALLVSFRAPRSELRFDFQATVARVVHGRRPADRWGRRLGLSFHAIGEAQRASLYDSIRWLPAPTRAYA